MAREMTLFLIHESGRNDALRGRRLAKLLRELDAGRGGPPILELIESGYHETMGGQSLDSVTGESLRAEAEGRFEPNGFQQPELSDEVKEEITSLYLEAGITVREIERSVGLPGDPRVWTFIRTTFLAKPKSTLKPNGDGMHHEVYDGFANALWVSSWADAIEELVTDKKLKRYPWPPGGSIDAVAPSVPAGLAARVEALFENTFGVDTKSVVEAAYEASRDDEYAAPRDAEEFGWQLGMRWLGHGTDLADAGEKVEKKLGHGEFHMDVKVDRTGAPGKASINYTNLPDPESMNANRRRGSKRRGSRRRR